jgi:hypothetical protein
VNALEQQGEVADVADPRLIAPRQALTFWPSSVTSFTPWAARWAISVSTSSSGRETSSPRV